MKFQNLLPLTLAGLVTAQDTSSSSSLTEVLAANNDTLSSLIGILGTEPDLVSVLGGLSDVTILAPSNDALEAFLNDTSVAAAVAENPDIISAVLTYHVLNGTYLSSQITEDPVFVETYLSNSTYENVTGGQVVEAGRNGEVVSFYSALKFESNVTKADLNFTGGVVHIINQVLRIPQNLSTTAVEANLTAVAGALTELDLVDTLDDLTNITVFAPSNDAFIAIGSALGDLSADDLEGILSYHVVRGLGYSSTLENGTLPTSNGTDVNISVNNGTVYVNNAKVITPDVLIANGVVHVIDNVLNPGNTTVAPDESTTAPAFPGATSVSDGGIPFTSNVPAPTATQTQLETAVSTQGGPRQTAAIAIGALFGGAALVMNGL